MSKMALLSILILGAALSGACGLDGEGKDSCSQPSDCLDGFQCNMNTLTCEAAAGSDGGTCEPATCDANQCGSVDDGCGGTVNCGGCTAPEECGANNMPNECSVPPDHCTNDILDSSKGETDTDCGGPCQGCSYGETCDDSNDCAKGTCDEEVCREGTWTSVAAMPTPRQHLAAVYGPDGLIYAIGGIREGGAGGVTGAVEAYNPSSNSWTSLASLPTPRYGLAAVVGDDGRIYAVGGQYDDSGSPFVDGDSVLVEAYTPSTNTWDAAPSLPNGRYKVAAVAADDGLIYAIGGFSVNPAETLATASTYDPGAGSWSDVADRMTTPRSGHGVALGADGRIYAVGGYSGSNELQAFEYYEPGTFGWHTLPLMPTPRKDVAAVAGTDGRIYALGGSSWLSLGDPLSTALEIYDPAGNAWTTGASLPAGRYAHATVTAPDGRIYLFGGRRAVIPPSVPNQAEQSGTVDVFVPDP